MTPATYRLPDGTVPVLLTSDTPESLRREAAAVLDYAGRHPDVTPQAIATMLFRTRAARRHRALAMVSGRDELVAALRAVADSREHPAVVRSGTPATARRLAYVFPGQGAQRPGMGRRYYESVPAFRAEADRCAATFESLFGWSPLEYLLDESLTDDDSAGTVQPALFTMMAALAAMWRSFGVAPKVVLGHSQGEVAAAYVSGAVTLPDAVRVIATRARAADEFGSGDYAMAVVATNRDGCEDALARCAGWAQLSVVNSPNLVGISGDRETVCDVVDAFADQDTFARVIRVSYPAHTSLIHELADKVRAITELQNPSFLDTEIACIGTTLGGPIAKDIPVTQYWFLNLRNTVRFDKAVAAAVSLGVDTFVELADHPTLQLAVQDNLAALDAADPEAQHPAMVIGTSERTAAGLGEFTRNLALLAVHDHDFDWDRLRIDSEGPDPRPLRDFPNTVMNETKLWLPYDEVLPRRVRPAAAADEPVAAAEAAGPKLLAEEWVRLSHRSLLAPRTIGIVDHTGACAGLAGALCAAAGDIGATARPVDIETGGTTEGLDTLVILVPPSPELDVSAAADAVATFFAERAWWPGLTETITECWLVTVGAEAVAGDPPPDPVHAAASAGFRCIGAEHPGVRFRHLDLDAAAMSPAAAVTVLTSLHTAGESELALRGGGLYAKRVVQQRLPPQTAYGAAPDHVLIIGGTGNLGLEFCDHFARRQARRITLVSRSGGGRAVADRLRRIGAQTPTRIEVTRCDVADPAAVAALADRHRDTPADLIVHAAVGYSGAELDHLAAATMKDALRAKVVGLERVLATFPRTDDCRVVLCSSIAANVGGRGLIAYAAANRMLDAMAQRLRVDGVDCVSVQWGQWAVTFVPDSPGTAQLSVTGLYPMTSPDALGLGMADHHGNVVVAAFDLDRARSVLETCGRASLLSALASPDDMPDHEPAVPAADVEPSQRLVKLVAQAIGVERTETIDAEAPMVAIGLDSLQALELRRRVKLEFGHDLEVADLLGGASIADVAARLRS
ncbi:nocobactin polyketide synthase NbtC [Mycobacterium parmense]|uniref:Putative polyketide synthase MbtD n=1 Tax=Mycobacterium parmense TaxID=185642 RepID=A0A7I7YQ24_9MYCO|nr:nocobactin polyketide synthase NbtC [Mycobacterium parmense]MCV7353260.1 nocobactin polyketide synthase NbtC [Mycobacterium parmense]ORW61557.1 polyketide synthase [Mycobacterium parmense]BBZ43272.1 putative polyketide synthase MbtD [Mycobacterium parmense]